jgi:hypothetical protein
VVQWIEAVQGVLLGTDFRMEPPTFLKHIAERSPYHVAPAEVVREKVLQRLFTTMGPGHSLDLISVFNVQHLMEMARQHAAEQKKDAAAPTPSQQQSGSSQPALPPGASDTLTGTPATAEAMGSGGDDDIVA